MLVESSFILSDKELGALAQKIERERDFDCGQFRQSYFRRRVTSRLRASGASDLGSYIRILDSTEGEWTRLIAALTVNVTEFFRDRGMWEFLRREIGPQLLERKQRRGQSFVRLWSAGCSSGQEPYSLAMLFSELAGSDPRSASAVRITATDYDRDCLAKAKAGLYAESEMSGLSRGQLARFTRPEPDGVRMSRELRSMVRFLQLDLFSHLGQRMMDMILCRNVLMYFTQEQQILVLKQLAGALNPGGYLILGKSEKLKTELYDQFVHVSLPERVYRKRMPEEAS